MLSYAGCAGQVQLVPPGGISEPNLWRVAPTEINPANHSLASQVNHPQPFPWIVAEPCFLDLVNIDNDMLHNRLKQGRNELVRAVRDVGGGWAFICRLEDYPEE